MLFGLKLSIHPWYHWAMLRGRITRGAIGRPRIARRRENVGRSGLETRRITEAARWGMARQGVRAVSSTSSPVEADSKRKGDKMAVDGRLKKEGESQMGRGVEGKGGR